MNEKPTRLTTNRNSPVLWYVKLPITLPFDPDITTSDLNIYAALDLLAGQRGWWYGEQDEILLLASEKAATQGIMISFTSPSTSTFRRAIKKLRKKKYIITERLGFGGVLKYYVVARNPDLPPRHKRT